MSLQITNLSKKYKEEYAVFNLSANLQPGALIGLIGPNGSGKSTLLKLLATLIKPSSGDILIDGKSIIRKPDHMRKVLGYLPQQFSVYPNLTASEFLFYMAALKGIPGKLSAVQVPLLLDLMHLTPQAGQILSTFSGGMLQRIGLANALLGEPEILIVDEPASGLDPQERLTIRNHLSKYAEDHIVIMSTHIISDIEAAAGRLLVMKNGLLLFDGTPNALIEKAHNAGKPFPISLEDAFLSELERSLL